MTEQLDSESIQIPAELLSRIDTRVRRTEFGDRDDYIVHILKEVLYRTEQESDLSTEEEVNEQQVQERLKSLGYLNE